MITFDFSSACSNQDLITDLVHQIMIKIGISDYSFQINPDTTLCSYSFLLPDFYLSKEVFDSLLSSLVRFPFLILFWLVLHLFYNLIPGRSD